MLAELSRLATEDLNSLWSAAERLETTEFARFVTDGFADVIDPYAATAGDLAASWYEESAPDLDYQATPGAMPNVSALNESASWALGATGEAALARLAGTLQRAVFDAARDTIVANTEREPGSRWARHASSNACEFCRLLATRGAVYGSRDRAMKSHDHCHCVAIEIRPGASYEAAPYVERFEREYIAARKAAGSGDVKNILAAWRQLTPTS